MVGLYAHDIYSPLKYILKMKFLPFLEECPFGFVGILHLLIKFPLSGDVYVKFEWKFKLKCGKCILRCMIVSTWACGQGVFF